MSSYAGCILGGPFEIYWAIGSGVARDGGRAEGGRGRGEVNCPVTVRRGVFFLSCIVSFLISLLRYPFFAETLSGGNPPRTPFRGMNGGRAGRYIAAWFLFCVYLF